MTAAAHRLQSDVAHDDFDEATREAKVVLAVVDALGIVVPDELRERIATCTDLSQLGTWVRRAATAGAAEDPFE